MIDSLLNGRMLTAQSVVRLGLRLRDESNLRVRQPLSELKYACSDSTASDIELLADVIADELNVKRLTRAEHLDELVHYTYKPNLKTLGPKYGKRLGEIRRCWQRQRAESREQRAAGRGQRAEGSGRGWNLRFQI